MNKLKLTVLSALVASVVSPAVMAHQQGDIIVRAGLTMVQPNDDSGKVGVDGLGTTDMEVSVNSNTQLGLNFQYMLTDEWGIELLAATPFSHDIDLEKSQLNLGDGKLGETKHLPPVLSAVYYFSTDGAFQPYAGLGINYTLFFEDDFTELRKGQGFSNLNLKNSFGLAAQLGFDYDLGDNLMLNASYRYIDIDTTASFLVGASAGTVDVDINPNVYTLSVGYKF